MNVYECNGTDIFMRWKMKCSFRRGEAQINWTFHLSPKIMKTFVPLHEWENIRYLFYMTAKLIFVSKTKVATIHWSYFIAIAGKCRYDLHNVLRVVHCHAPTTARRHGAHQATAYVPKREPCSGPKRDLLDLRGVEWVHGLFLFPLVLGKMLLPHAKLGLFCVV